MPFFLPYIALMRKSCFLKKYGALTHNRIVNRFIIAILPLVNKQKKVAGIRGPQLNLEKCYIQKNKVPIARSLPKSQSPTVVDLPLVW